MFRQLKEDVDAILKRDPAAHSRWEVILCYPGFKAVRWHRYAHKAYLHRHFLLARIISAHLKKVTGIDIHPGAEIGKGLFIDHGTGVVIGETAVIGDGATLYQGVTLGGTGKDMGKRHPTLGNNVTVGSGAKVLGPVTIGNQAKIGAGAIVLKDVPDHCTAVGNPARIVKHKPPAAKSALNQTDLLDPMMDKMEKLCHEMIHPESAFRDYAEKSGYRFCKTEDFPFKIKL